MKPPAWKAFEIDCAARLHTAGWRVVMHSQPGDQGVDLLASKRGVRVAIQCKHYTAPVGNAAVQEAYAGKSHYRAHHAAVVSLNGYTPAARALAASTGVSLLVLHELSRADRLWCAPGAEIEKTTRPCRCGLLLRLPKGRAGYVTCPTCGYRRWWAT
jgi:hypothetical protein